MITNTNLFALDIDLSDENNFKDITINGEPLWVSTHWERYKYTPRYGRVVGIPNKINTINRDRERNIFNEKISVGDIVFFHHYAAHEDNLISYNGIDYYFQNYEDLYAVIRNDKIIPLEDWIFVRPLEETDDDISIGGLLIKPNKDIHVRNGQIAYINDYYSKQINVKEGDNIVFEHNSNYPIEINGEMLYRTKVFKVLSKINQL